MIEDPERGRHYEDIRFGIGRRVPLPFGRNVSRGSGGLIFNTAFSAISGMGGIGPAGFIEPADRA